MRDSELLEVKRSLEVLSPFDLKWGRQEYNNISGVSLSKFIPELPPGAYPGAWFRAT
jgi:hypothetical protein